MKRNHCHWFGPSSQIRGDEYIEWICHESQRLLTSKKPSLYICPKWNSLPSTAYYTATFVQYCRNDHFRLLSFFVPACWKHDFIHPLFIMHPIDKAFDHFKSRSDFSSLSLANLLLLPLANIFLSIPDSHWLVHRPRFLACSLLLLLMMQPIAYVCGWEVNTLLSLTCASDCTKIYYNTEQYDCSRSFGALSCKTYHIPQKIKLLIPLHSNFNINY